MILDKLDKYELIAVVMPTIIGVIICIWASWPLIDWLKYADIIEVLPTIIAKDTIEEKIVATADAVAHIMHPLTLFYAWYGRRGCSIDEGADGMLQKLEKSWNKIEFQNVKNKMEKRYNMLINMLKER